MLQMESYDLVVKHTGEEVCEDGIYYLQHFFSVIISHCGEKRCQ